jgi:hypothetical protein
MKTQASYSPTESINMEEGLGACFSNKKKSEINILKVQKILNFFRYT